MDKIELCSPIDQTAIIETCTDIQSKLYDLLDDNQKIINNIIGYFISQGFRLSCSWGELYSSRKLIYYLNSVFNLISIEIDCHTYKIKLDINKTTYEFKVNGKTFTDLIRIIENNLDKMRKNKSESN